MPTPTEESQGFYEMLWDCPHCDTKGLLGKSQRHCPECGAPQDASKRYFPTPEQQKLVVGHVYEGADRSCPSCSAPQSSKAKNCTQCGSPLDGSKEVAEVKAAAAQAAANVLGAAIGNAGKKKRSRGMILAIVLGVIAVVAFLIWFLFIRTHSETVQIASHSWQRTIAIEEYGDVMKSAWQNEVPGGVLTRNCAPKQRSTNKVPDGQDCHTERHDKKDGTFEQVNKCSPKYRDQPVMDQWCTYQTREWHDVHNDAVAKGSGMTQGAWPTVDLGPKGQNPTGILLPGQRRQGARTETLTLVFASGDTCDVAEPVWRKYADGQNVKVDVRARSGDVVCDSL